MNLSQPPTGHLFALQKWIRFLRAGRFDLFAVIDWIDYVAQSRWKKTEPRRRPDGEIDRCVTSSICNPLNNAPLQRDRRQNSSRNSLVSLHPYFVQGILTKGLGENARVNYLYKYLAVNDTHNNYEDPSIDSRVWEPRSLNAWINRRISNYDKILYGILIASSMFGILGVLSHRR